MLVSEFNEQISAATPGTAQNVTINTPGQAAEFTFSGTAGQTVSAQMTNGTFAGCWSETITILNPDGSTLTSAGDCGANLSVNPATMQQTGTYTVVLQPLGGATGTATVLVSL